MMDRSNFYKEVSQYYNNPSTRREIVSYILSIRDFSTFEDWKNVILVCFEIGDLIKDYPREIIEKIEIAQKVFDKSKVNLFLIDYLKYFSDPVKDFSNFFYPLLPHLDDSDEHKIWTHKVTQEICIKRFEDYCTRGTEIKIAFNLFYSCWDKVDTHNIVHILPEALSLMRVFVEKEPEKYLRFLLRPMSYPVQKKFNLYYPFVFEPFTENIFHGWGNFENFLDTLYEKVEINLLEGIKEAFKKYKDKGCKLLMVYNKEEAEKFGIDSRYIVQMRK